MEKNKDYIYLNKHVLKYLNKISIDFLFINSKFTNIQGNLVYIKDVNNKEGTRFQIKCPSGLYSYKREDVIRRLLNGAYYNFCIPNEWNIISEILDGLFNHYQENTTNNISFDDLENFYNHPDIYAIFFHIGKDKIKYSFNNYFDKVLYNQTLSNNKPNTKEEWNQLDLNNWLKHTKNLNLSLNGLITHINQRCGIGNVCNKLEGMFLEDKAKILYNKWNESKNDSVRKATLDEIPSKQKTIKKWSVGSYVVFLKNVKTISAFSEKGNIDKIIKNKNENCITLQKFNKLSYLTREIQNEIKWFATYQEAAEFSKSLEFEENKIAGIDISNNPCEEYIFSEAPDECVKKASKRNRKLLL